MDSNRILRKMYAMAIDSKMCMDKKDKGSSDWVMCMAELDTILHIAKMIDNNSQFIEKINALLD